MGVFLFYASKKGAAFIDRILYLPHEWAEDPSRREEAGVPKEVWFAIKGELAKEMLRRAPMRSRSSPTGGYGTAPGMDRRVATKALPAQLEAGSGPPKGVARNHP